MEIREVSTLKFSLQRAECWTQGRRRRGQRASPAPGGQTSELLASQGPGLLAAAGSSSRHLISMHNEVVLLKNQETGRGSNGLSEWEVWRHGSHGAKENGLKYPIEMGWEARGESQLVDVHGPEQYGGGR